MKICPQCNTTYSDETLNFCLEDGSVLSQTSAGGAPPPTVMVPDPRESLRQQPQPTTAGRDEVKTTPRYQVPPQKKSKAWLWVLAILFGVVVLCGGGLIGFIALVPLEEENEPVANVANKVDEKQTKVNDSVGDPSRKLTKEDDLADWEVITNDYIRAEVRDNALVLTSIDDYYYVVLSKGLKTYDSSTLLTVRNITGEDAESGYGLVFHSEPKNVLNRDYAFLIKSDNGTYRIVQHTKNKERNLINWTKSNAVRRGKSSNDLEVRTDGDKMEFFINGELVEKLTDYTNYEDGIAGIYTSDEIPIAFSKLELRK